MPARNDYDPKAPKTDILDALQEKPLGNVEEVHNALEKHQAKIMGFGDKVEVDEDKKVVDIPKPHQSKEKPIWEQYGYPDEKSFRKVYPNAGKSVKKDPRGVN